MHWLAVPHDSPQLATSEFKQFMQGCFPLLSNSDGSWKCSRANRLRDLDERLTAILLKQEVQPRVFMDVGMGNGISTIETIHCLERAGLAVQTIATDRNLVGYVVRVNRHVDVLAEENGHILLIEGPGWDLSPYCERKDYLSRRFFVSVLKQGITAWARRQVAKRGLPLSSHPAAEPGHPGSVEGPFLLVTPELKNRPDVVVRPDDLLEPLPADLAGVADVVRIANVLRPDRFTPPPAPTGGGQRPPAVPRWGNPARRASQGENRGAPRHGIDLLPGRTGWLPRPGAGGIRIRGRTVFRFCLSSWAVRDDGLREITA